MAVYIRRYSAGVYNGTSSTSAPSLNGLAGSLITVLDYCLTDATYGCGWTKAFSGTNQAAYRSPAGTNQFYLFVDDTLGLNAAIRGYESMTSISAGTGAFPTVAQSTTGRYLYKSDTASTAAREWFFASNGKIFYFIARPSNTTSTNSMVFGDFVSYKASDAYNTVLIGNVTTSATTSSVAFGYNANATMNSANAGCAIARTHVQTGSAVGGTPLGDYTKTNAGTYFGGNGGAAYPDPISGGVNMSPIYLAETSVGIRGFLPGVWFPLHATIPFASGDTFTGANDFTGKTFEAVHIATSGQFVFETSDTWATA